ncbi:MAG: ThaI family type II restriction endonuclease [Desulfurococcales archaeon]|nr:ThaI family type II restriction endonuclease [Desulfurococcales archaeon]
MDTRSDPLIGLFQRRMDVLDLLGRVWELLYIEGYSPDIGKRRENFIKLLLKYEFGLEVISAPDTESYWDFKVRIKGRWYTYSLKTTERPVIVKVAWDGFPSYERARSFEFSYPILYITANRKTKRIDLYVFTQSIIDKVRSSLGRDFWWIPRKGTNPRGFGISTRAIRILMEKADKIGNHVGKNYEPIENIELAVEEYWRGWYRLLKSLAGYNDRLNP